MGNELKNEIPEYKRNFLGIWIKKDVWLNRDLSIYEKVFLVEIESLSHLKNGCIANNYYFSTFFNLSKSRCSQIISGLEQKGYIKTELFYKKDSKEVLKRTIKIINLTPPTPFNILNTPFNILKDNNNNINNTILSKERIDVSGETLNSNHKVLKRDEIKLNNKLTEQIKYWNKKAKTIESKEINCRIHRLIQNKPIVEQNKTIQQIAKKLKLRYNNHIESDEINTVVDIYISFISRYNITQKVFQGLIVGFNEFFDFDIRTEKNINLEKNNPLIGEKSWFDIIRIMHLPNNSVDKTVELLLDKYVCRIIDEFTDTTFNFKYHFAEVTGKDRNKIIGTDENNIIHAAKLYNIFHKKYGKRLKKLPDQRSVNGYVGVLFKLKKYDASLQSHFLRSKNLWDSEFLNLLKKEGYYI